MDMMGGWREGYVYRSRVRLLVTVGGAATPKEQQQWSRGVWAAIASDDGSSKKRTVGFPVLDREYAVDRS